MGNEICNFLNHLLNSVLENHHSGMLIGGPGNMDLLPYLGIFLHRHLMAKQSLLPLVVVSDISAGRSCGQEGKHCACCTEGDDFYLQKVFQKHQIFMLPLKKHMGNDIKKPQSQTRSVIGIC